MYLCKKKFNKLIIWGFSERPTYDPLLDYWDGKGKYILSFEEAKEYLHNVFFENSPYKINTIKTITNETDTI